MGWASGVTDPEVSVGVLGKPARVDKKKLLLLDAVIFFHPLRVVSHNRAPDLHVTVFPVQG